MSVDNPDYYRSVVYCAEEARDVVVECFDVLESLGLDRRFNLGAVFKYIWRAGRKTPDMLADLKKARVYLSREIDHLESLARKAA